jgi:hypothetical protein
VVFVFKLIKKFVKVNTYTDKVYEQEALPVTGTLVEIEN